MRIRTLGVVGAGTMGSGIAALAASAGVPVVLLDIPGDTNRSAPAAAGLDRALKAKPAAFMDPARARLVRTGNTEDHLPLLADCDWIIEAIVEQAAPKRALFERLEPLLAPGAIVSTNTSGIPIHTLTEGRAPAFRARFLGAHFFNPPRYLHLLEIIPTPDTSGETVDAVRRFSERVLGKGVITARDVPGFVANRLGVFGMLMVMRRMEELGLSIDEADTLTGPLLGRAKSATFRTADITGLDVLTHVTSGLVETTGEDFTMPPWVGRLVSEKSLGEKTGAGFYRRVGKSIETLDWRSGAYIAQQRLDTPEIRALAKLPLADRLRGARSLPGAHGEFVRRVLADISGYVLETTPVIAYDVPSVDQAMEWGYAWDAGPFRVMDMLGHDIVRKDLEATGITGSPLLAAAHGQFYSENGGSEQVLRLEGGYAPLVPPTGTIRLASLARDRSKVLDGNEAARIVDMGSGVLLVEFRSKMNTLGPDVFRMLDRAEQRVREGGFAGIVIGNEDPRTFTAGADLSLVAQQAAVNEWKALDAAVRAFQSAVTGLRRMPFPVVVAPFGLTLGGGAELTLHAARVQSHAELYMGLVEAGVGLLPAGGGTKELLFRFTEELAAYDEADPFEAVKRAFRLIAMARTSGSALEARAMGFLNAGDRISMNRDRLVADARQRVLDLAEDYVAPTTRIIRALGRESIGNLEYALWAFHEAGQASEHDVRIGHEVAYVLSGGDGPPRDVTEQDILDLEREGFLKLLGTKETQERIRHMLETGKPLRN